MLCEDLKGWDGGRVAGKLEEGDMCLLMTDSCYCIAELNTTLESSYPGIKN